MIHHVFCDHKIIFKGPLSSFIFDFSFTFTFVFSDINECLSNNGGCRVDKQAKCINYPGGFYCGCNRGYILADNSLTECVGKLLGSRLHLFRQLF